MPYYAVFRDYDVLVRLLLSPSRQDSDTDLYTLTLRTYARALAGHTREARAGLAKLKARATSREGMMYWQNSGA